MWRGRVNQLFNVDFGIAKRALRFARSVAQRRFEFGFAIYTPHAFAAAAGDRLEQHRIAMLASERTSFVEGNAAIDARRCGRARLLGNTPRGGFRSKGADGRCRRPNEDEAGIFACLSEIGVFAEESVSRMDSFGAVFFGRVDDAIDAEIAFGRCRRPDVRGLVGAPYVERSAVGVGIHRDAGDVHLPQRADDADCDLAAIGDEDLAKHEAKILAGGCGWRAPFASRGQGRLY